MVIGQYKIAVLCTAKVSETSGHTFISELGKQLAQRGYRLFVYSTCSDLYRNDPSSEGERSVFDLINYDITDILIVCDERIKSKETVEELIANARTRNIPVIVADGCFDGCVNLRFDYETGFERLVRHVTDVHGKKRIHFMAGTRNNPFSDARINVTAKVLAEKGIPFDESCISYGDFWSRPAAEATERLIADNRVPEAFICANDIMAITVINVLKKHGINVPQDVIVTGFDGIDEIKFSQPSVTSCFCNYVNMAERTAELAVKCVEEGLREDDLYISCQPIIAESCGCKDADKINLSEYFMQLNNHFCRYQEEEHKLSEISLRIQNSDSLEQVSQELSCEELIYDMCCLLKKECIDETINPMGEENKGPFGDSMYVIMDSACRKPFIPYEFDRNGIVPGLNAMLETGYPLIFSAVSFLDIPLGFVSFGYNNYDIQNYSKISQTVGMLNTAIGGFRNMRYQKYLKNQVEEMYKLDPLTGLFNRSGFAKEYLPLEESIRCGNSGFTAVLCDMDGLKNINDSFSHAEGDKAIRIAARAMQNSCPPQALCTRFGGDELFAICEGKFDVDEIKNKIYGYIDLCNSVSGKPYKISASVGVYVGESSENLNFESLLKKCDELMYADKLNKKNRRKRVSRE